MIVSNCLTSLCCFFYYVDIRIGRMAYVRVMLMVPSCMRIGTKICAFLVMEKMVDSSYFRFIFSFE